MADNSADQHSGQNLVIPTEKIPPAAWQAIYHHLTKKTETARKIYKGAYEIDKERIVDLAERLRQSITGFSPQAHKLEVTISFRKDTAQTFSSLEKFISTDVSHKGSATKSVVLDFDFIICPGSELPETEELSQKYRVFVIIDQDFFEENAPTESAEFFEDGAAGKNILAVIEYADYTVSRALQSTLDDWVSTLQKREASKWLLRIPTWIRSARGSIPIIAAALALVPFVRFATSDDGKQILGSILAAAITALFISAFFKVFVGWVLGTVAKIQPTTYLVISAGDVRRKSEINGKAARRKAVFGVVSTAVILGFLIGTLSSLFAGYLLRP